MRNLEERETAEALCEFVHCTRWMGMLIPHFARKATPLVNKLETAYKEKIRRTKRAIEGNSLQKLPWVTDQKIPFKDIQSSLRNDIALSHPEPEKTLCIYTDASEKFWSVAVPQLTKY